MKLEQLLECDPVIEDYSWLPLSRLNAEDYKVLSEYVKPYSTHQSTAENDFTLVCLVLEAEGR